MSTENSPVNTPKDIVSSQDSTAGSKESKLLKFDENNTVSPGKDINTKITALDADLAHMRTELGAINASVEEGLDRLGDTDMDLTAKVAETYKRLGEIDNAYKSLLQISSRIDTDIQKINGDVSTVAEQSATGIKDLEQTTIAQSHEFIQKNQQVASSVKQLVETSKLSNELLGQKIQSTTETMLQIEKRTVAEIESLSSKTKEKSDNIKNSVDSNKAKILKLQAIDEAIIKRATTLEISSAELMMKNEHLKSSVEQLESNSNLLSDGVETLKQRTTALEELTSSHGTLIGGLQKISTELADKLAKLTGRETRHFNIVTGGFLLLLALTAVIYFSQQYQFGVNDARHAEQSILVDSKITNLQQTQQNFSVIAADSLTALESKIDLAKSDLQEEIKKQVAQIDYRVQTINDQVKSIDGRLSQTSPFSQIGDDNIIHSTQWLKTLPAENFIVQLAYVDNMNALYEIAHTYNYYLKDKLSYLQVNDNGLVKYVLLSGNYTTQKQAAEAIDSMPRYIDMQQPLVRKIEAIQKHISQ
jgi:chromosome segregation ATPase